MREITEEDRAQIAALRENVADLMHPIYDTDFNLLRWLDHARYVRLIIWSSCNKCLCRYTRT